MTTLDDEHARLKKLDAERTQGNFWAAAPDDDTGASRWKHYAPDAKVFVMGDDCTSHPIADTSCNHTCRWDEEAEANAQYLAAAPAMMAFIDELMARLGVARGALDDIADINMFSLSPAQGYKAQLEHERERVDRMRKESKEALAALDAPLEKGDSPCSESEKRP